MILRLRNAWAISEMWALASQNSIITAHCETKLSASTGVGEWLAFLADSDNATLKACCRHDSSSRK